MDGTSPLPWILAALALVALAPIARGMADAMLATKRQRDRIAATGKRAEAQFLGEFFEPFAEDGAQQYRYQFVPEGRDAPLVCAVARHPTGGALPPRFSVAYSPTMPALHVILLPRYEHAALQKRVLEGAEIRVWQDEPKDD